MSATHTHTVTPGGVIARWGEDGLPVRPTEVWCVFKDDPTSDDAMVVEHVDLSDGDDELTCPVCNDRINREGDPV